MLGDTGVAVHPEDERWRDGIGQKVLVPIVEREISIVADSYADPEMGSGAVKLTPAHDPNDYEVGKRHDLPQIQVIGFDGIMTGEAGDYAGQERYACRESLVLALKESGHLIKIEEHEHAVPHHDKCGTVIEPLPMEQWFMRMQEIAAQTRPYLEREEIQYVPERFRGYALDWLDQIRDWALSRQIWWGHRIPAWYCLKQSRDGLVPLGGMPFDQAMEEGKQVKRLPMSLGEALERLANDEVIKSSMPDEMYKVFHWYKNDEWERFMHTVTDWDMETYIDCLP